MLRVAPRRSEESPLVDLLFQVHVNVNAIKDRYTVGKYFQSNLDFTPVSAYEIRDHCGCFFDFTDIESRLDAIDRRLAIFPPALDFVRGTGKLDRLRQVFM